MVRYLLAPAGNFANLRTAIDAGADSVYLGVKGINMWDNAANFTLSELKKALAKKNLVKNFVCALQLLLIFEIF